MMMTSSAPCQTRNLLSAISHRIRVKMVGGLVQNQEIGRLQQQTAEQHARLLASAELAQGIRSIASAKSQAFEHLGNAYFVVIATSALEIFLCPTVVRKQHLAVVAGGHLSFHGMECRAVRQHVGEHGKHLLHDRVIACRKGIHSLLAEVSDGSSLRQVHLARGRARRVRQARAAATSSPMPLAPTSPIGAFVGTPTTAR